MHRTTYRFPLFSLATPLLFVLPALGQDDAVPLVMQGDNIPGIGNVQILHRVWVNSSGDWLAEVDTDAPSGTDNVLLLNGTPVLREGDVVSAPGGTVFVIDGVDLNEFGQVMVNHSLLGSPGGSSDNEAVYLDGSLIALEGDAVTAPQASAGTDFVAFDSVALTDTRLALLRGFYDDPAIQGSTEDFVMRVNLDSSGAIVSQEVLGVETQIAAGTGETINLIRKRHSEASIGGCGDVIWGADLNGDVATDGVVYFNDTLVAREGSPTGHGGTWGTLDGYLADVNDNGDWLLSDSLADSSRLIVVNGQPRIEEGDTLPATAPFPIDSVGAFHAELDDLGRVLWHGDWNGGPQTEGLFLDDRLLVRPGVTVVGGAPIQGLNNGDQGFSVSANGRYVAFQGSINGGGNGFFLMDLGLGTTYCTSGPNSSGLKSTLHASGTLSISENDLTLVADNLPANVSGVLFYGPTQLQIPFGNGTRCVGGAVQRLPKQTSSKGGILAHRVDYQAVQFAGRIVSGSTWNFQAWYRDPLAGGAAFDLSDAVSLTFQP